MQLSNERGVIQVAKPKDVRIPEVQDEEIPADVQSLPVAEETPVEVPVSA